jgi:demethylmenaquinone methyltransferase/2-methoxy-6-polyprenyl-1,4-benzoquinol methylase
MSDVLDQQIAYYRARAHEYDALLPSGPPPGLHLLQQMESAEQVLELACGTGVWTHTFSSCHGEVS